MRYLNKIAFIFGAVIIVFFGLTLVFNFVNKGEVFKIEKDLPEILKLCFLLKPSFVILSCHTPGYTPLVLNHLLKQAGEGGTIESGELVIPGPLDLASGTYARWYV